jgi:hypothetical protein
VIGSRRTPQRRGTEQAGVAVVACTVLSSTSTLDLSQLCDSLLAESVLADHVTGKVRSVELYLLTIVVVSPRQGLSFLRAWMRGGLCNSEELQKGSCCGFKFPLVSLNESSYFAQFLSC